MEQLCRIMRRSYLSANVYPSVVWLLLETGLALKGIRCHSFNFFHIVLISYMLLTLYDLHICANGTNPIAGSNT